MAIERKTRIVLEAQAKGFEKAKREVKDTFGPAKKGAADTNREMKGLDKTLEGLNKNLDILQNSFKGGGREGQRAIRDLRREIKALDEDMRRMTGGAGGGGRARDARGRFIAGGGGGGGGGGAGGGGGGGIRGGFLAGALQGVGMGEVFPQQGFNRNVAGRLAGRAARRGAGIAGGFGQAGFSGVGGLASAMAGIPVVGGFLSGQLQNLMATSGQGLQSFQERQALLPMMNAAQMAEDLDAARAGARRRAPIRGVSEMAIAAAGQTAVDDETKSRQRAAARRVDVRGGQFGGAPPSIAAAQATPFAGANFDPSSPGAFGQFSKGMAAQKVATSPEGERKHAEALARTRQETLVEESKSAQRSAIARAERSVRNAPFNALLDIATGGGGKDTGRRRRAGMGVMSADVLQFAGGLAGVAGGGIQDFGGSASGQEFFRQALGARQVLGIGQDVSGAFARGERQGVIGGVKDKPLQGANMAFTRAIGQGMRLALEGSDLTRFMQMTAQTLMNFEQTGMPLDPAALGNVGMVMARAGLGGIRGTNVAQGLLSAGQQLGGQGPTSAIKLLMFRHMYGFKGGGIEGFAAAQRRAAEGDIEKGGVGSFIQALLQGQAGPGEGQLRLQTAFQELGVRVGPREMFELAGGKPRDPQAAKEAQERLNASQKRADAFERRGPAGLAEALTEPAMGRQARIGRTGRAIGRGVVGVAQTFEEGQQAVVAEFSKLAPQINKAAKALGDFATEGAEKMVKIIERIEKLLERAEGSGVFK